MSLWGDVRTGFGMGAGQLGNLFGMNERGWSERLGGNPSPFGRTNAANIAPEMTRNINSPAGAIALRNTGQVRGGANEPRNATSGSSGTYDLNTAISRAAADEMAKTKKMWESLYMQGLASYDEMQSAINANRINISGQLETIKKNYGSKKKALGAQLSNTLEGQRGFFNTIAPEAYQSQEKTYADKATGVYDEGMVEVEDERKANEAIQAQAMMQTEAQQSNADAYKTALETYRTEGGIEPTKPSMSKINPAYQNRDLSKYYTNLSNLYLANTLSGMTKEQNKMNIKSAMQKENLEPELQDFLYQQIFPEDYQNNYYPSASDYQMLNEI